MNRVGESLLSDCAVWVLERHLHIGICLADTEVDDDLAVKFLGELRSVLNKDSILALGLFFSDVVKCYLLDRIDHE